MTRLYNAFRKNRSQWIVLAILAILFIMAIQGMSAKDWVITLMRGLSVGAVTFLVAAGFSLIFGLLDVLNLAHGTLFMIGAYVGWTVYVRPDTFIDILTPVAFIAVGFVLAPLWRQMLGRVRFSRRVLLVGCWIGLILAIALLYAGLSGYPVTKWNPGVYEQSPVTYAFLLDQGNLVLPQPRGFENASPALILGAILVGSFLATISLVGLLYSRSIGQLNPRKLAQPLPRGNLVLGSVLLLAGGVIFIFNNSLTDWLFSLGTNWLFVMAVVAATLTGGGLGAFMETGLIRPLYVRPIYQLMLTLGLSAIGIEVVRAIWGRPEFTMPKPAFFNGTGAGCPAASLTDWISKRCSTILVLEGRLRVYNEIFLPLVGIFVLVGVWILLQRSRLGMIIRAGVQDREMVEALGINVRRVFTLVFALGVGLAALGGVLAAPSMGLSNMMGENLMLNALIALAIGGLTSYPGAAAGSVLVGLMQQFIIKYGQIGITLPFLSEPFKPTPPLVPASTVLLMVIVLLAMPQGLFGRKE
jgi:branched-chain amino acid transport system permease protein